MFRNSDREIEARRAAARVYEAWGVPSGELADLAIVLGTGWGGKLALTDEVSIPLAALTGFENLSELPGHARMLRWGLSGSKRVLVLDGRVHLNEAPALPSIHKMVRLQTEMLCQLGARRLILTCAAGSLRPQIEMGEIVIVNGYVTVFAPDMPLWGGEFCSPEDTIADAMSTVAYRAIENILPVSFGAYVMLRGPQFEGRAYDKRILRECGASAVGMSMLPEACVAALYDAKTLGLCFITNDATEVHSHEENRRRAKVRQAELGAILERIIAAV